MFINIQGTRINTNKIFSYYGIKGSTQNGVVTKAVLMVSVDGNEEKGHIFIYDTNEELQKILETLDFMYGVKGENNVRAKNTL